MAKTAKKKFEYKRISASMLKTFLQCKRKFHKHYIEGIRSDANESFSLGTSVHYGLELANLSLVDNPRELNPLEVNKFVVAFRDMAASLHVNNLDLFEVGEQILRKELKSYNLNEKIIGVEKEFDLVTPEGVRIYGFMDKVVEVDPVTVKVVDYKTSRVPMSYDDARTDEQLSMYDLATSMLYPEYENVILELKYLRTGEAVRSYRNNIEQVNFRRVLLSVDKAIKEYVAKVDADKKAEAPEGVMNEYCSWCTHKLTCEKYVNAANELLPTSPSTLDLTDEEFVETYERVSHIIKAATSWKDSLKIWAAKRIEEEPDGEITNGEKKVYTLSTSRRDYDAVRIGKLVGLDNLLGKTTGKPLIKINSRAMDDFLNKSTDRKLNAKVEEAITVKFNSPQIRLKKDS